MDKQNEDAEINLESKPLNQPNNHELAEMPQSSTKEKLSSKKKSVRTKSLKEYDMEQFLMSDGKGFTEIASFLKIHEKGNFWETVNLDKIMRYYYENEGTNILNFFTILIHDWNDQTESTGNYFLVEKFEAYDRVSSKNESIFTRFFRIFNDVNCNEYHEICLMIIYYYFDEAAKNYDFYNKLDRNDSSVLNDPYLQTLLDNALVLDNYEYKSRIIKIILTFWRLPESVKGFKERILKTFEYELSYPSICKISYKSIIKYIDSKFFHLAFLLKENFIPAFKIEFQKFIKTHKELLGEAWQHVIKFNAQLLYHMAYHQRLVDTKEMIEISTGIYGLKHSFCSYYKDFAEFRIVFESPLNAEEDKKFMPLYKYVDEHATIDIDDNDTDSVMFDFHDKFKNTKLVRKLLFGRRDLKSLSLFEELLSRNRPKYDYKHEIDYIWNEFRLWEKPEILLVKNPQGRSIIDYIVETRNNGNIISVLHPKLLSDVRTFDKPCQFMMLKNALFYDSTEKSVVEFHLDLIEENNGSDDFHLINLFYLFEEMGVFNNEQKGKNEFVRDLFDEITKEKSEKFDGKNELKLPRKHFLIGIMMAYWMHETKLQTITFKFDNRESSEGENSSNYGYLFFKLLFLIINDKSEDFHKEFPTEMEKFQNFYKKIYELDSMYDNRHQIEDSENIFHFYEKYTTNFFFVLLYAAIKTNQKSIVDHIFKYENFLITIPNFPTNMEVKNVHEFTALKFIENKYEIGRNVLPKSWITPNVLEDFLNSRITSNGNFYKIDCRFTLPYYNYDVNIKSEKDVNNDLIFNEDFETINYIINDNELQSKVVHPVMETIIRAKMHKYFFLRFDIYYYLALSFMLNFILLYVYDHTTYNPSTQIWLILILRILLMGVKEFFEYKIFFNRYHWKYFGEKRNLIEILPLFFSLATFLAFVFINPPNMVMITLEILNYLALIIVLPHYISNVTMLMWIEMFKRILLNYWNIIKGGILFFFGFGIFGFFLLSEKSLFMQYLSVDVHNLLEGILFTVIIAFLITKTYLLFSLAINDFEGVIHESRKASLLKVARNYVELAESLRFFCATVDKKEHFNLQIIKILKIYLNKNPFLHRIQTILIDKNSRKLLVDYDKSLYTSSSAVLDLKTFDDIKKIIENREKSIRE